jgi:hypothetical protein
MRKPDSYSKAVMEAGDEDSEGVRAMARKITGLQAARDWGFSGSASATPSKRLTPEYILTPLFNLSLEPICRLLCGVSGLSL